MSRLGWQVEVLIWKDDPEALDIEYKAGLYVQSTALAMGAEMAIDALKEKVAELENS